MAYQFCTDCEGPISKNDNAMELSEFYIPRGGELFARISRYDDYLADVERRPGYKAGDTLKLILPFLKAFGATEEGMREFSRDRILLVPGAPEALERIRSRMDCFIISTSYAPYIEALCETIGFPKDRISCTEVHLDRYPLEGKDRQRMMDLTEEILRMEILNWPERGKGQQDLSDRDRETLQRLDEIFWKEIPSMGIGAVLTAVNPVGGPEKAKALIQSLERTGNGVCEVLYVGDSITDVEVFDLVRREGGVTVSFNGNRYALRSAEIACVSPHALVLSLLAEAFQKGGRQEVLAIVEGWERRGDLPSCFNETYKGQFAMVEERLRSQGLWIERPMLYRITEKNRDELTVRSEAFRKQVRGIEVGTLG